MILCKIILPPPFSAVEMVSLRSLRSFAVIKYFYPTDRKNKKSLAAPFNHIHHDKQGLFI